MPIISGLDFIRSLKAPPLVIFTTAYPEYALDGHEMAVAPAEVLIILDGTIPHYILELLINEL